MTAAIVLAAGASTRLGEPKQLVMLGGETLLERAVRVAREAGCAPVLVVVGASFPEVLAYNKLGDAIQVINNTWQKGMATSIERGVRTLGIVAKDADGVVLMTCDQPAVTPEHLRALAATGQVIASAYAGRRGVPAYFPSSSFPALLNLQGDAGARELLREAATVDLAGGELDVDTAADLEEAIRLESRSQNRRE
jgi:molybdenum cofactor cytidylyltransferase